MKIKNKDIERYSRQIILPEVGGEGQKRLKSARVLLVGGGGLGSPAALYLAAAGVGTLVIVDNDAVDLSNLQRQILHFTQDMGKAKVLSAREKLISLNPGVKVLAKKTRFTSANADRLLAGCDLVLDGSDNFETRYAVNAACVAHKIPLVWGAVLRWEGQLMTVFSGKTACYQCLFPEPPDPALAQSCSNAGIMGSVAGTIGTMMATEALKVLLGKGESLSGRFWGMDFIKMRVRERGVVRRRNCPVCAEKPGALH
ncbi:MAG: HesA/MoeB/ThiF family protein [Elusimicrobia bacterium]|nr:HesA/MoeB/ThiF family protein [Elusimicrobiota bacterium]